LVAMPRESKCEIATEAGINDQGQVSKLMKGLEGRV